MPRKDGLVPAADDTPLGKSEVECQLIAAVQNIPVMCKGTWMNMKLELCAHVYVHLNT